MVRDKFELDVMSPAAVRAFIEGLGAAVEDYQRRPIGPYRRATSPESVEGRLYRAEILAQWASRKFRRKVRLVLAKLPPT